MKKLLVLFGLMAGLAQGSDIGRQSPCYMSGSFVDCYQPVEHTSMEGPASSTVSGYLSSTDWAAFNTGGAGGVPATRTINTTAPLTGGGNLSADRTFAITQSGTAANGYLSSTDWSTFNSKQTAISIGAIGSATTNGITLSAGTLALAAADSTNGGAVTAGTQTIGGAKTFAADLTLGANLTYSVTNNNTPTGSNANVAHATSFVRLTNASLVSVATLDQGSNGHQVVLMNATGAAITIINNYGSPAGGTDPIITGTGANEVLADKASVTLVHSTSSGVWSISGRAPPLATSSVDGLLSSTDWSTFNSKQAAITQGNLTETTSSVLTITGGTSAVIGSGTTIAVTKSDSTHNGYVSSTDWTTFNSKVGTSRTISTTSPLSGGGDLSADRTLSIPVATSSANGYLSSADWATFNNAIPRSGSGTLGTITFNSTPPSSVTNADYKWYGDGTTGTVTFMFRAYYGSAGTTNTTAYFTLPTSGSGISNHNVPTPAQWTNSADGYSYMGGVMVDGNNFKGGTQNGLCTMDYNDNVTTGDKWAVYCVFGSASVGGIVGTITYPVQ